MTIKCFLNNHVLWVMREFRLVTMALLLFMCYWGWDAYQFVNIHIQELSQWQLAYYGSIVLAVLGAIKMWTGSNASKHKNMPDD